jgi:hypothetical protein
MTALDVSRRAVSAATLSAWSMLAIVTASGLARNTIDRPTAAKAGVVANLVMRQAGKALAPVAQSSRYLVWVSGPANADTALTLLMQRDLNERRTRTLARNVDPNAGIAVTRSWVAYVAGGATGTLYIVRHDGSHQHAIGHHVVTQIASRGVRVAWADQTGQGQRVYVYNLATDHRWLAAALPRCVRNNCYRIDYVTLAESGIVFTRGAVGPQPSYVIRRRFGAKLVERVRLPGDPQPDLAPSSAGALYYYFGHGWYRWDFKHSRPALTRFKGYDQVNIAGLERENWYLVSGTNCRRSLRLIDASGRATTILSARRAARLAAARKGDCAQLTGVQISKARVLTAWTFQPTYAINAHTDFGLVGAIERTRPTH